MGDRARAAVFGNLTQKAPASYGEGFEVRRVTLWPFASPTALSQPGSVSRSVQPLRRPSIGLSRRFVACRRTLGRGRSFRRRFSSAGNEVSSQNSRVDDDKNDEQPQKPAWRIFVGAVASVERRGRLEKFAGGRKAGFEAHEASREVNAAVAVRW